MKSQTWSTTPHRPTGNRRFARGFTLIEVLIVISIIGILAALILPAVNGALTRGRVVAEYNEISQLSLALEQFKNKYGVYPPSRIRLRENTAYATSTDDFDKHSVKWLKQIWPDIQLPDGTASNVIMWCKDTPVKTVATISSESPGTAATAGNTNGAGSTYELEGDECLVFFLGGIAEFDRGDDSQPIILHGFTDNPRNPGGVPDASIVTSQSRVDPLYQFNADRLFIRTPPSTTDNTETFDFDSVRPHPVGKLPSYRSRLVADETEAPYAYFSAYEGAGFRANDCNFDGEPVSEFQQKWPTVTIDSSGHPESPGPNPYAITEAAPANDSTIAKLYNENSFQLISPGFDGLFGSGGTLGVETAALDDEEDDNIGNFTEGSTIGDFYRNNVQ